MNKEEPKDVMKHINLDKKEDDIKDKTTSILELITTENKNLNDENNLLSRTESKNTKIEENRKELNDNNKNSIRKSSTISSKKISTDSLFNEIISSYCPVQNNSYVYLCLRELNKFKIEDNVYNSESDLLYHTFWKLNLNNKIHLRVFLLQISSFLATQDISKSKFIIWTQLMLNEEILKLLNQKFGYFVNKNIIQLRVLNFTELCSKGIFKENYNSCVNTDNGNSIAFSDFIRFLVLYSYGGIYTDGDVIFLRDMKPFFIKNFVYRWSFTHDYNTAIMGILLNHSENIENIYKNVVNNNIDLVSGFYPSRVKNTVHSLNNGNIYNYKDLEVYHSALFDPAWLCNDGVMPRLNNKTVCVFKEFYDTYITADEFDYNNFYGGAFTYHLHLGNCGRCEITETSFFYHFENYFIKKINKLHKLN